MRQGGWLWVHVWRELHMQHHWGLQMCCCIRAPLQQLPPSGSEDGGVPRGGRLTLQSQYLLCILQFVTPETSFAPDQQGNPSRELVSSSLSMACDSMRIVVCPLPGPVNLAFSEHDCLSLL